MGNRLYVGNLSFDSTEDSIRAAFGADGRSVSEVTVMMDRDTGRPRGFGFVEMGSSQDAQPPSRPSTAPTWTAATSR